MEQRHQIPLSADQRHLFKIWHRADPPDEVERQRNRVIKGLRGTTNAYISSCSLLLVMDPYQPTPPPNHPQDQTKLGGWAEGVGWKRMSG